MKILREASETAAPDIQAPVLFPSKKFQLDPAQQTPLVLLKYLGNPPFPGEKWET
jgi:hypothetical protein